MTQHPLAMTDINRWFPSTYHRGPNWMVWLALMACFCTVFIKIWTPTSVNRWPEAVTTLLFIYPLVTNWTFFKKQPMMIFWALAIASPFVFFGINYLLDAESAVKYAEFEKLPRIYLFIPIAWWLGGNNRTIAIFLSTALVGFFFACLQDPDLAITITTAISGHRVDFGIHNWEYAAMFFSLGLIGSLSYLYNLLIKKSILHKVGNTTLLLIAAGLCTFGILATQTRAAFLGLFTAFILGILIASSHLISTRAIQTKKKYQRLSYLIISVITISYLGFAIKENLTKRFKNESSTIMVILEGDWQNIPYSNIGLRLNTWIQAFEWIAQKPIIGYGGKVRTDIIQLSTKHPEWVKTVVGHFHNSYIEITLGYGILGLVLAFAPAMFIFKYCIQTVRPVRLFSIFGLVLFLVMNMFESYLFFWAGPFTFSLIIGPIFSMELKKMKNTLV